MRRPIKRPMEMNLHLELDFFFCVFWITDVKKINYLEFFIVQLGIKLCFVLILLGKTTRVINFRFHKGGKTCLMIKEIFFLCVFG